MNDWAQWMIDHNMRYIVLAMYLLAVPVTAIGYLRAQEFARNRLQSLREAIDRRDAMSAARKYVGGA